MSSNDDQLLDVLLDSWDRANVILVNLLRAIPPGGLAAKGAADSPSVAQLFMHVHYVRLAFVSEDAPEFARDVPAEEWRDERDVDAIARMLDESAIAVREAVVGRLRAGKPMDRHYDHPILFIQHMIWHEGYHHGQIKLALKGGGHALDHRSVGRGTWGVWMKKTS